MNVEVEQRVVKRRVRGIEAIREAVLSLGQRISIGDEDDDTPPTFKIKKYER